MDKLKKAAREGYQAFKGGLDLSDCPYDSLNQQMEDGAFEWICSFRDAQREHERELRSNGEPVIRTIKHRWEYLDKDR